MKGLVSVLLAVPLLVLLTLLKNQAALFDAPGIVYRLKIFLGSHVAETSASHPLPELRPPSFNVSADGLFRQVVQVALAAGWQVTDEDLGQRRAAFVVRSPVFAFRDDVSVRVIALDDHRSTLQVRSASRVGKADFAANAAHIRYLFHALQAAQDG